MIKKMIVVIGLLFSFTTVANATVSDDMSSQLDILSNQSDVTMSDLSNFISTYMIDNRQDVDDFSNHGVLSDITIEGDVVIITYRVKHNPLIQFVEYINKLLITDTYTYKTITCDIDSSDAETLVKLFDTVNTKYMAQVNRFDMMVLIIMLIAVVICFVVSVYETRRNKDS